MNLDREHAKKMWKKKRKKKMKALHICERSCPAFDVPKAKLVQCMR